MCYEYWVAEYKPKSWTQAEIKQYVRIFHTCLIKEIHDRAHLSTQLSTIHWKSCCVIAIENTFFCQYRFLHSCENIGMKKCPQEFVLEWMGESHP